MAGAMLLIIFFGTVLSMGFGKTPDQHLEEKFQELQTNLSSSLNERYLSLEKKYNELQEDLKVLKIIHGKCAPCLAKHGNNHCDCRNLEPKKDCLEFRRAGFKIDGLYKLLASKFTSRYAYCDQTSQGGGWTVIQRRKDGSENFYRDWNDYKNGFGNLEGEFWFGNENTHNLIANLPKNSSLLINMVIKGQSKHIWAKYNSFSIGDESTKYMLHVSGFSGNTTDRLTYHNNMKFSTKDQDNDKATHHCSTELKGAWWYNHCYYSHLNGLYNAQPDSCKKINWGCSSGHDLEYSEMKVRRNL